MPSIASDGIQEIEVTWDSMRISPLLVRPSSGILTPIAGLRSSEGSKATPDRPNLSMVSPHPVGCEKHARSRDAYPLALDPSGAHQ